MKLSYPLVLLILLLCACQSAQPGAAQAGPLASPSPTPVPTVTPSPSPTPTIAQLIYPYTIDGLRHHSFQSGSVTVVKLLEQTPIYTRYSISYPSDGLTITGIMQIPAQGHAPFPVIVMDHGYFDREGYVPGDGTYRAAEYLNQHGYLTLAPDYRSWGSSGVGPSLFYTGFVIDVLNLVSAIPTIPQADAARVGIWGHSMGGGVTLKVLELDSGLKAGVLYSTVSADDGDVIGRWGPGCIGDIHAGELQSGCDSSDIVPLDLPPDLISAYQAASQDPELLRQTSSLYHLELISAPVEINYGTDDGKVLSGTPPEWSKKLYMALLGAGRNAALFGYDGQTHSFNGDAWNAFMERSSQFFDQYVKGAQ
jgi:uncharacterized protein